ncbi:MAG: HEAT repeat domain-containing protein [Candidatus Binatia bacterium]
MASFEQSLDLMRIDLEQVEGTLILLGVCDDIELREHAVKELRRRLPQGISLRDFRYDPEHLSLLEGAGVAAAKSNGHVVVSVTGFEDLPHDKRTEAIKLLNLQRNRFGDTGLAVILWVDRATLAEISTKAADFYSWRSGTFTIEPPPDWDTLASGRRSYLQALARQNEFVNLQGLAPARGGHIVQMRMEDIFIPLSAEQEVKLIEEEAPTGAERSMPSRRALRQRLEALVRHERKTQRVEIPDLLRERRAVVLGDPGAGKTTLLRNLAYTLAHAQLTQIQVEVVKQHPDLQMCLPVYVRIGEYAQHLQHHPTATIEEYAPHGCQARQLPLSEELLKAALDHNQVVFLLDGLDEVIATDFRREVVEQLTTFARRQPQCRIIVTSRIVGYREAQLGGEFTQFTIRPFADAEIQRFVRSWYAALREPESNAERLIEAITENTSVRRLASNPLLLTVIALIHWRGTKLPQQRAKLYSQAAETLVDQWMSYRRVNPEGWDAQETLHLLLPAIAWHLHATTSNGLIGEQDLHSLLVATLQKSDCRLSEQDAHTRAAQFRRNVSEFSGIFLERGLDHDGHGLYGFLHLTFEEYFAAVHLAEQWQREGQRVLKPLLHNLRWTEVLLLMVGHLGDFSPYLATQFVKNILKAKSAYENILHRDLLLAARCLAEDVRVDAKRRRTIMNNLLNLYFDEKSPWALQKDIQMLFVLLGHVSIGDELLALLTERLSSSDALGRTLAILALGELGGIAATPEVMTNLHESLTDPVWSVREAAADAIGKLGPELVTSEVVSELLNLLGNPDSTLRTVAARTIGKLKLKVTTPEVLAILLENLSSPIWEVRDGAASALSQLGQHAVSPSVISTLCNLLSSSEMHIRGTAAVLLGDLAQEVASVEVLGTLLTHLTDPNSYVRWTIASAIGRLVREEEKSEVLETVIRYLHSSDRELCKTAIEVLGQIGHRVATQEILFTLSKLLDAPDWEIRKAVVDAFGEMGLVAAQPEIIEKLVRTLSDPDGVVRRSAVIALSQMGQVAVTQEIKSALFKLLEAPEDFVRVAAVAALGKLGQLGPTITKSEIIARVLPYISDHDSYLRVATVRALDLLGTASPEVLSSLVTSLRDTKWEVRSAAAEALQNLSVYPQPNRAQFVQLILPLATSRDAELRNTGYVCLRNLLAADQSELTVEE